MTLRLTAPVPTQLTVLVLCHFARRLLLHLHVRAPLAHTGEQPAQPTAPRLGRVTSAQTVAGHQVPQGGEAAFPIGEVGVRRVGCCRVKCDGGLDGQRVNLVSQAA